MWTKIITVLIVVWIVSTTTGQVNTCYSCPRMPDTYPTNIKCSNTSDCDGKPLKYEKFEYPIYNTGPTNEICLYSLLEITAAPGTERVRLYDCSPAVNSAEFKPTVDVDAMGCYNQTDLDLLNNYLKEKAPQQPGGEFKFVEFCTCTTNLCNDITSKFEPLQPLPPQPPTPVTEAKKGGGAEAQLLFYLLSPTFFLVLGELL